MVRFTSSLVFYSLYDFTNLYYRYQLAITSKIVQEPYTEVIAFLSSVGRLKYIQPLYLALLNVNPEFAVSTYHDLCGQYHPIAQDFLEKALKTSKCQPSIIRTLIK